PGPLAGAGRRHPGLCTKGGPPRGPPAGPDESQGCRRRTVAGAAWGGLGGDGGGRDTTGRPAPGPGTGRRGPAGGTVTYNLRSPGGRFAAWLNMHVVDHGLVRSVYNNFYDLGGGMYRSSQPSPSQIRSYHR